MIVRAYAKINLTLRVLDKRPDGYHNIDSIMQTISLHDTLDIKLTDKVGQIELNVEMIRPDQSRIDSDPSNLCYKAAQRFLDASGVKSGVSIRLQKLIPSQAGLGGGSSDAAITLKTLNQLTGEPLSLSGLTSIAATLGADVPFFLTGGTCSVTGIGEMVEPCDEITPMRMVILKPSVGVSTTDAYASIDEQRDLNKDQTVDQSQTGNSYLNDFESVVFNSYPEIASTRDTLLKLGCDHALLCGSGSAVAGLLFPTSDQDSQSRFQQTYQRALSLHGNGQISGELYPARTISRDQIASDLEVHA